MRRVVSILFLSLMLLQAIPLLHFFSSQKEVFYALIDEEKPGDKVETEKKEGKEFCSLFESSLSLHEAATANYFPFSPTPYTSPTLDALTPPPNAC